MAFDRTLCFELNRLAGTLDGNDAPTLDEQGAANVWAGTDGLALQGALNVQAGTSGLGLRAVCNLIAATTDLDPGPALATIV